MTRGAVLSQAYAEFQDVLVAMAPVEERAVLGQLLLHLERAAHKGAGPGDVSAFQRYADASPEAAAELVRVLAMTSVQAAQEILDKYPGFPVPPVTDR